MESIKNENNLQQFKASYNYLPYHVIEHIMSYLPLCDILSGRATCHNWLTASEIMRNPKLRESIMFSNRSKCGYLRKLNLPIDQYLTSPNIYENMSLSFEDGINNDHLLFFQHFGMYVKNLKISVSKLDNNLFVKLFNSLPSIVHLELDTCNTAVHNITFNFDIDEVPVGITNLKSLKLGHYFTKEVIISRITKVIPNLEKFSSIIQFYTDGCSNSYSQLQVLRGMSNMDVLYFLRHYRQTLKTLKVPSYFFNNLFKNGPVIIKELDLKELSISTCHVSVAIEFILTQKNLTSLDLRDMILSSEQIQLICDRLDKLETLSYSGTCIPSESIKKYVKALYITPNIQGYENRLNAIRVENVISSGRNETLEVFHYESFVINKTFSSSFVNLPNLRDLYLLCRRMDVDVFQLIFKYLTNLESLKINWNDNDLNLSNDTELLNNLGCLNKLKCLKLNSPAEMIPGFSLEHLMKLKNLRILQIHQLEPAISIADQIKLMQSLPLLKEVDFKGWNGIDQEVIIRHGVGLKHFCKCRLKNNLRSRP